MRVTICPQCGNGNPAAARFCDQCGCELTAAHGSKPGVLRTTPDPGNVITIGRDSDNDVVLDYPMVSGHHAKIVRAADHWLLVDLNSTNGTAIDRPEQRIREVFLPSEAMVYFGSLPVPASRLLGGNLQLGQKSHSTLHFSGEPLILGRAPTCDVVLDYPMISARHARLQRSAGKVTVEDLGSTNGTYVNGERISGKTAVAVGAVIGLGSYTLRLTSPEMLEQRDYRGNVTIEARDVAIDVPSKRLLEKVSLTIYPSELTGLMGPSGAGKTTLMNALNGYNHPTEGTVLFNQVDLYPHFERFRMHVGYVPQEDIMHRELTVREALFYSARLRLPGDFSDTDIHERIEGLLAQLGLRGVEDTRIGSPERRGISGGQRKRVNLAMELITEPLVLFLDEPTSGLSSEDALMVMRVLRRLADDGKTILITIHQPSREVFQLMDSLVLLGKDQGSPEPARCVFFGPAYPDSIQFFTPDQQVGPEPSPNLLLRGLSRRSVADWVERYEKSTYQTSYVAERRGSQEGEPASAGETHTRAGNGLAQWWTLLRRSLRLKMRDAWNTTILLAQAPIIAVLIVLVFTAQMNKSVEEAWLGVAEATGKVYFLLVITALWFGCSNSAREIVAEWAVYHRERMINLKIFPYTFAKLAVLGGLCAVQCLMLLGIVDPALGLEADWLPIFGLLLAAALIGVALGLVVSALARSSEVAISLVPLMLLPMVILGGAIQQVHNMEAPAKALSLVMPSRWALEGLLILESDERPSTPIESSVEPVDPAAVDAPESAPDFAEMLFPKKERATLSTVVMVLGGMFLVLVTCVLVILRSRDVH